jgi:hypothetical protein
MTDQPTIHAFITERADRLRRVAAKPSHPNFHQQEAAI